MNSFVAIIFELLMKWMSARWPNLTSEWKRRRLNIWKTGVISDGCLVNGPFRYTNSLLIAHEPDLVWMCYDYGPRNSSSLSRWILKPLKAIAVAHDIDLDIKRIMVMHPRAHGCDILSPPKAELVSTTRAIEGSGLGYSERNTVSTFESQSVSPTKKFSRYFAHIFLKHKKGDEAGDSGSAPTTQVEGEARGFSTPD